MKWITCHSVIFISCRKLCFPHTVSPYMFYVYVLKMKWMTLVILWFSSVVENDTFATLVNYVCTLSIFNSSSPRQNGRHFADVIIWTNAGPIHWRIYMIYTALRGDELKLKWMIFFILCLSSFVENGTISILFHDVLYLCLKRMNDICHFVIFTCCRKWYFCYTVNFPGIPSTCATRNFTYLVRGPCMHRINVQCIQNMVK